MKVSDGASCQLIFPEYLDGYEHETESKGHLVGVKVVIGDTTLELAVYDPTRLAQESGDEIRSAGYFAEECIRDDGKSGIRWRAAYGAASIPEATRPNPIVKGSLRIL